MAIALLALATAMTVEPALAIDKIYSPNVTGGELEIEYSGSAAFANRTAEDILQSHEAEIEYGLTDRIMLELNSSFENEPYEGDKWQAAGFGGRYQFFEQGENWLDSGVLVTYNVATQNREADSIEAKILLEKQWGQFLNRVNFGIEQEVGKYSSGGPDPVFLWNSRYRFDPHFEPGFEIQSDFGKVDEIHGFNHQQHYIGPAVFGEIVPHLKYEAAYYRGVSNAAAKNAGRLMLEYEVFF